MSYTFVLKNGGWWLKISSLEELVEYYKNTKGSTKWWNVFDNYINEIVMKRLTHRLKNILKTKEKIIE